MTTFSAVFEINGKLLTGRKLLNISSSPSFLRRGITRASFQFSGITPLVRDELQLTAIPRNSRTNNINFALQRSMSVSDGMLELRSDVCLGEER